MKALKEKILLLKVKKKDQNAFAEVYDEYVEKIYRFIFFKVNSEEEAKDLTSEVFLRAWDYLIKDKKIKSIKSFLYQIARNLVVDHYRDRSRKEIVDEVFLEQIEDHEPRADKKTEIKLEADRLQKYIRELKDDYKEAVLLKFIEEYSIGEIADILKKTKGNVRVLLHRAIKALQMMAERHQDDTKN